MAENTLESYLVKLGAQIDASSFAKFDSSLLHSEKSVTSVATSIVKDFLKIEATIIGTFASVGLGIIGLADKAAMADQQYRLFGLRMLMGKDAARAMQMATDDLGASLDEIAYDPELNARFRDLYERNMKLFASLGPNFDENMKQIRGIRTEVKHFLNDELSAATWGTISELYSKLGFGSGNLLKDLRNLNDEISTDLPGWIDKISTGLVPVWNDFVIVMKDTARLAKMVAGDFTYLVGVFSGDQSIQNTEFSVENLAKALLHVVQGITEVSLTFELMARIGVHSLMAVANAAIGLSKAMNPMSSIPEQKAWFDAAKNEAGMAWNDIKDFGKPGDWSKNPDYASVSDFQKTLDGTNPLTGQTMMSKDASAAMKGSLGIWIKAAAQKYGIDPTMLASVMWKESRGNFMAVNPKSGAAGLMQFMPDTAAQYGVNRFDPFSSVMGGAHYLADLMKKYGGDESMALAAYNWGPGHLDQLGMGKMPAETRDYVDTIMSMQSRMGGGSSTVAIQNFNVNLPPGTPDDHARQLTEKFRDLNNKDTQYRIAANAGGAYATVGQQ